MQSCFKFKIASCLYCLHGAFTVYISNSLTVFCITLDVFERVGAFSGNRKSLGLICNTWLLPIELKRVFFHTTLQINPVSQSS